MSEVTFAVVNYKTLELTRDIIGDLVTFYPRVPRILIDNGSEDRSTELCKHAPVDLLLLNEENIGHGPALDQAMQVARTRYVFTLDTDTRIKRAGFVVKMVQALQRQGAYAIGWLRHVNENGVAIGPTQDPSLFCPYVHPCAALWDRDVYSTLPPFVDHGAPAVENMQAAYAQRIGVLDFPVWQYVDHMVAGTRRMFGGHWHPVKGTEAKGWDPDARFPI